jgi:predicted AAA+ superfamily ATPase
MLKPWREIIVPHKDVAGGKYQQAEFAANLAQVVMGTAEPEYQDAFQFFDRTYLTQGMRTLLITALKRASSINGEPVTQLKTAFGGGKTHSMLALYHLFKSKNMESHKTIKELLKEVQLTNVPNANVCVLVGTDIDSAKPRIIEGTSIRTNTLWGYMAYQLGGESGYSLVKEADQKSVSPGEDSLLKLFNQFGPCIILIDELVAYTRNIYGKNDLPSGTFDSIMTFIQALTDSVKRSRNSMLIASIPESDIEIGGEGGTAALERIEHIFKRVESVWKPITPKEGFEIVRRRLFEDCKDETGREEACKAFSRMYSKESETFPTECKDASYLDRLRESYPIHPEVFDRLYNDWSTLDKFQRTRGVLRLMAATIHELWISGDHSFMIMPGSIPLDSQRVKNELTGYLSDEWNGIVDSDIDGDRSEPKKVDESNSRFGKYSAARKVSRTIFLGSAPSSKEQKNRGLEDLRIILGAVQPEENISTFRDALSTLSQKSTYLYYQGNRYWYDSHPNLRKTVDDRASRLDKEEVYAEIVNRLQTTREKGDFAGIHICAESEDISDEDEARLVVLSPKYPYKKDNQLADALIEARQILDNRGNIPRQYKNMLVFLAPDVETITALNGEVRRYLAWQSVVDDKEPLNLDAHQSRQANENLNQSDKMVNVRLNDAYSWLLVPTQEGTKQIVLEAKRVTKGEGSFVSRASKQAKNEEILIPKWSPALLKNELDKWLWTEKSNIVVKQLWDYFASYPYLPRLRDSDVLVDCIEEGLRSRDFFGYASNVDSNGKYLGLEFGNPGAKVILDNFSVLIKVDLALKQVLEEENKQKVVLVKETETSLGQVKKATIDTISGVQKEVESKQLKRFYGRVGLDPMRVSRDAGQIAEEVIQHLAALPSSEIKVSLEITANTPDGIPENIVRIILENCKTLKFETNAFEE